MEEIWPGSWPTALSNVAAFIGGTGIQLGVVWNVRVNPICLGCTSALKNIHVFMHSQLNSFFPTVVPTVVYRCSLLWERIFFCFRVTSVSMWYLLLRVFI